MPATVGDSSGKAVRNRALGLLAVGALVWSACARTARGPEHVDPAAFSWNAPVAPPATVYVRNLNGSVEVRPATNGNVQVTAEVRWHRGDPRKDIRYEAKATDDGALICAVWGDGTCSETTIQSRGENSFVGSLFGGGTDAEVAFTVYVPTGVKVDVLTINGSVGVAATAPVKARTVNGSVKVATSVGPVDAEAVTGDVDVRMTTLGGDGPVRARSVTGTVAAYVPEKLDASVNLSTTLGSIASDFPAVTIAPGAKSAIGTLGAGGRSIEVGTVTGTAALRKLNADGTIAAPEAGGTRNAHGENRL